jgi:hypothetical protein
MSNNQQDLDPDDLYRNDEALTRKWLPTYVDSLRPKTNVAIDFEFAESSDINAFAQKTTNGYRISINKGLIKAFLVDLLDLYEHELSFRWLMIHRPNSGDSFRDGVGTILAIKDCFLVYVALHELAHIVHGHLDWLQSTDGIGTLSQVYPNAVSNPRTFQALEFDADLFAIRWTLLHFPYSRMSDKENVFRSPEVLGAAMALLFNLLGDGVTPVCEYDVTDHPAPGVRFSCIVNLFSGLLSEKRSFWELSTEAQKQWTEGCFGALQALREAGRCRLPIETLTGQEKNTLAVDPHIERHLLISKRLQNIASELSAHSPVQLW